MKIRLATSDDAGWIAGIYAPYVRDTVISFEMEPPSAEEMARRIETTLQTYPWLVAEDVHEGREELNFSTWNQYKASKQGAKIEEIWEEVEEDEMPLWYYVLLHQSAELSDGDREILQAWSKSSQIGAEQQEGK